MKLTLEELSSLQPLPSRKKLLDQKRALRKSKTSLDFSIKVPKEERINTQKIRNRQAAQRSRQIHRKYVEDLQNQVKELRQTVIVQKEEINRLRRNASRQQLRQIVFPGPTQSWAPQKQRILAEEDDEAAKFGVSILLEQQNIYQRLEHEGSSSAFQVFFLLCLISLAVFCSCGIIYKGDLLTNRILQSNQPVTNDDQSEEKLDSLKMYPQPTTLVPFHYPFSPFSQDQCLASLIRKPYSYSRQASSHLQVTYEEPDTIFCPMPKIIRKEGNSGFFTNLISIVMSGQQMLQIVGQTIPLEFEKILQFEGIYSLTAEIREFVKIEGHNCSGPSLRYAI